MDIQIPTTATEKPACDVFGTCGGCAFQHLRYAQELKIKEEYVRQNIEEQVKLNPEVWESIVASPQIYHYRHRLDLKLFRRKSGEVFIGFSPQEQGKVIPVDTCPIGMKAVTDFIPTLKKEAIAKLPATKYREANLVVRTGDEGKVVWGGIGRRSLQLNEKDYLWTTIEGRKIYYSLDTFFQANLSILPELFKRIIDLPIWSKDVCFFDLYGGVGLFSFGLLDHFGQSVLIEEVPASLRLAEYNKKTHQANKVELGQGKVEDLLAAMLTKYQSMQKVAMIDPPRAGLSPDAAKLVGGTKEFQHILYLSCHPGSLARDLAYFVSQGWKVERIIPFDFFPRTRHVETLVLLNHA